MLRSPYLADGMRAGGIATGRFVLSITFAKRLDRRRVGQQFQNLGWANHIHTCYEAAGDGVTQ